MFCSQCGKEIAEEVKFCPLCGNQVVIIQNPIESDSQGTMEQAETKQAESEVQLSNIASTTVKKPKLIYIISGCIIVSAALIVLGTYLFLGRSKPTMETEEAVEEQIAEASSVDAAAVGGTEETKVSLSFKQDSVVLNLGEDLDLSEDLVKEGIEKNQLFWTSDNPNQISINQEGIVSAIESGVSATITVKSLEDESVFTVCSVKSLTKGETFQNQLIELNSVNAQLESINVYEDLYTPETRNMKYKWNTALFYSLEEINPDSAEDGLINSYDIEKKQLVNEETKNRMEYEIYRNPDTDKVNKIVSIEYYSDHLEIVDYYYTDKGKVNFVFVREDLNYIPTYAIPTNPGKRYYFNKDVMVKWRVVEDNGKQKNYVLGEKEKDRSGNSGTTKLYADFSEKQKKAFDKSEKDMMNAAYNTYNIVLKAEGINNINGYVSDENGNSLNNATIKLFSVNYDMWVYECKTDADGQYSIILPSEDGQYQIQVEKAGFINTMVYNIETNRDIVGVFQDVVSMVKNTTSQYDIQLLLWDAFNIDLSGEGMLRLDYALLRFRKGVNNKDGEIYLTETADENGEVMVTLEPGSYTVEVNKDGYETAHYNIVAKDGNNYVQINTSPILNEDEVRIILTWGDSPSDLDSHLFTPYDSSSGDSTYHIWYGNQIDANNNTLDVDDTTSYGPETMTINHLDNGLYKYYVADYSNCSGGNHTSVDMSYSSAMVSVYDKSGLVQTFYVPNNCQGVIWEVFEIRNKRIIPTQRYYSSIAEKTWWNNEK